MGQNTAPEVNFTFEGEIGKNPDEEDNTFYQRLKSTKEPLEAQNIPGILIWNGKIFFNFRINFNYQCSKFLRY